MYYDKSRSLVEFRLIANVMVAILIGATFAMSFDGHMYVSVGLALLVLRPWSTRSSQLHKRPVIWLAFLSFFLLGLLVHWSDYSRGVSDGQDAAEKAMRKNA